MRHPIPFGKYLLLERISVGGMAEVFKAKSFGEEGFEKILAIKRILPSMAEDDEFIEMFIDEAKISGQLSHPNIGQIYELGKIDDSHFIAMEFVWGKDVLQIQNRFRRLRQKMPLPMATYIASRVCEGLDYAHRKHDLQNHPLNIIHRDVSPQNVLVSYAGEVKIIDFGIAKARSRSSKTQAGVLKGKFGYMSPEQVRALPLDQRSDIFAIGTLLYEMCTGERLFTAESDFATLEKVRNSLVPQPSKVDPRIPPELEAVMMRALKRDPEERYQWASEMQEDLSALLMTQSPIFTAKTLSATISKMFDPERKREEAALEQYKRIRREDADQLSHASPAGREQAVSLLPQGPPMVGVLEAEEEEGGATQIGGAPGFGPPADEVALVAEAEVLSDNDLMEVDEEEHAGATQIFAEQGGSGGVQGEIAAEPTFIFNAESGQLVQLAEQSTVIFSQGGGNGGSGKSDMPDQGPTVIFDANLASAVAPSPGQISGTMAIEPRPSMGKDILIGVLVAMVVILGIVLFKVFSTRGAASTATLVVTATPPREAEVYLDGERKGQMKSGVPFTLKELAAGQEHRILVRAEGLDPVIQAVTLAAGDVKVVSIAFKVPKESGHLQLRVTPSSSKVQVNGAEVSSQAAAQPLELKAGKVHEIRISQEGYKEEVFKLELKPGERLERTVSLEPTKGAKPEPKAVAKKEEPKPEPKAVAKKEEPRPAPKPEPVAKKEPTPKLVKKETPRPEPKPKVVKKETPRPEPKPKLAKKETPKPEAVAKGEGGEGFLVANTVPWAKVLVDGKDTGKTTPIAPRSAIPLKAGKHKVTFDVDGKQFHFPITITAGQTTRLIKKLTVE
jgi:serine/threonine protein kinase